jgi:hypothetical protein
MESLRELEKPNSAATCSCQTPVLDTGRRRRRRSRVEVEEEEAAAEEGKTGCRLRSIYFEA